MGASTELERLGLIDKQKLEKLLSLIDLDSDLLTIVINEPTDGQTLTYDGTSGKWKNADASGGGGNFFVTITSDELSTKFSSDKTVAEIVGALQDGLLPVAIYDTGVYALSYVSSAVCFFTNTTPVGNSQSEIIGATLNSVIIMSGSESDVVVDSTNLTIAFF